ncbi:MAG TPA: phage tail sheath protein [Myxococcales bacterium]|nr:phage tail sheath protein [Myxococcales bacterium]
MARIVPGVQVTVVKDVVPQQLAPSGVLGLVGVTEKSFTGSERASSWSHFVETVGPGTAYSMPEARQALDNGVFQIVVSPVEGATAATVSLPGVGGSAFTLTARAGGPWANGLPVRVTSRKTARGDPLNFDLEIRRPNSSDWETHRQLSAVPGTPQYLPDVLAAASGLAVATSAVRFVAAKTKTLKGGDTGPQTIALLDNGQGDPGANPVLTLKTVEGGPDVKVSATQGDDGAATLTLLMKAQAAADFVQLGNFQGLRFPGGEGDLLRKLKALRDQQPKDAPYFDLEVSSAGWPLDGERTFTGGADAGADAYSDALQRLRDQPDVDMVLAAIQDFKDRDKLTRIYGDVISHCQVMSADCKGRVGLGQAPPDATARDTVELAKTLMSDRFVLTSPPGVVGAVAGMIGSLEYYESPTFKRVSGLGKPKVVGIDDQNTLVGGGVVTVSGEPKGVVVLRGLTTDGDQINVRRVADHAVRGVKMLGDLFIGSLNTETGRNALKQKLSEFLLQMEKEGALVPSTDGSDPAFKVNVYSSQMDFALGIVRVDIAVRPVRAIDYIYATIQIQV